MSAAIQTRRALSATALVAALMAGAALSGSSCGKQAAQLPDQNAGFSAHALMQHGDPLQAIASLEEDTEPAGEAPRDFEREIGFLPGYRDVRTAQDGAVVGYLVDRDNAQVLGELGAHMAGHGWTEVPLGQAQGASFVKPDGKLGWAVITCTQIGDATCVVVRSAST